MKTVIRALKFSVLSLYLLAGVGLAVVVLPFTGLAAKTVATGSMRPAIPAGSLVIIHESAPQRLRVNDVVTYHDPAHPGATITHRIVSEVTRGGLPFFTTKGDANPTADPEIVGGSIVGKVVWHIPVAGQLVSWIRQPLGLLVVVVVPGLLIIADEVRRLNRNLAKIPASLPPAPPAGGPEPAPAAQLPQPVRRSRSTLDGVRPRVIAALLVLVLPLLAVGVTRAVLRSNSVTLAGNAIMTAPVSGGGSTTVTTTHTCNQTAISGSVTAPPGSSATSGSVSNSCTQTTNINIRP